MENSKKIDFSIGIFDVISDNIKNKIKEEASNCELYGVGVYTDEIVIEKYSTYPVNKIEERMKLARQIEGVDFVFPVNKIETEEVKKIVKEACLKFLKNR